MSPLSMM